jgi:hypothetical protein
MECGTLAEATEVSGLTRTCHGFGQGMDYRWLGEKPGRAASCSAERQMLRGMAKVSISLWS